MMNKLLKKAQQLYQEGRLKEALDACQRLLKDDPNQPEVLHLIAVILAQMENYQESLDYLNRAIHLDSENAIFYNSKGNILLRTEKFIDATKAYYKAIALKPNYAVAYSNLGNSFYHQHRLNNAIIAYKKAIALDPNFTNAHFNYGRLLTEQEEDDHAIVELKTAIDLYPSHMASDYSKQQLALNPNDVEALNGLGIALLKENHWLEAKTIFKKMIALQPKYSMANYHLATAYLQLGEHKKALSHYLKQIENEKHLESYYNIGVLLMYQEHHRDAIDYFKKTLTLDPIYVDAHINIAAIYLKINQHKNAIEHYEKVLELKPNDLEILHILSALSEKKSPPKAPPEYIQHLFDHYALYYDQHLTKHLHYRVPEQLFQAIEVDINTDMPQWTVVDLGCGTGLCGEFFKGKVQELIGVDLSEKMLEVAKHKGIYHRLIHADIQTALTSFHDIHLILATDVLMYVGDLDPIFEKVKAALKANGFFAFTVEKTTRAPYVLQKNIRYAHSKTYIETLIKKYDFHPVRFDSIILRQQQHQPVEGFLVVIEKLIYPKT